MWRLFQRSFHQLRLLAYRRRIEQALAFTSRGAAGRNGLRLKSVWNRLEIEWCARDLHPWDRDLPPQKRAQLVVKQCLADTEEAILTLFTALPQIDVLELKVVAPGSDAVLLAGTVHRSSLAEERRKPLSVKMRLNDMGVRYRSIDSYLESFEAEDEAQ
jgi:hypothetical protein